MTIFLTSIVVFLLIECFWHRRLLSFSIGGRWTTNASLAASNVIVSRFLVPFSSISAAAAAEALDFGLLNVWSLPVFIAFGTSILLIDLRSYAMHRMYHSIPLLWRLHLVHHSDPDVDVMTVVRHHPLDHVVSVFIAALVAFLLGVPVEAAAAYAALSGLLGVAQHANIAVPPGVDKALRTVFVTPDMHRIHHSSLRQETDSNFANLFSFWDRMFGTYVAEPRDGYAGMDLGIGSFNTPREQWCDQVLLQPFRWKRATPVTKSAPPLKTAGESPTTPA